MPASPELLARLAIRRSRRDDVPAIVRLYAEDTLGGGRERADHGAMSGYLEAWDEIDGDPRCTLFVAEVDGRVVGTFQLAVLRHLMYPSSRVAQVEAVHVTAEMRGRGIGEAMMRFAVDEARRRGCTRMQLTSNKRRTDAHRFYARLGFVASHEGMKLML